MASAVHMKLGPHLTPEISVMQRGFVGNRSVWSNLVDVDESMQIVAFCAERGAGFCSTLLQLSPASARNLCTSSSLHWDGQNGP